MGKKADDSQECQRAMVQYYLSVGRGGGEGGRGEVEENITRCSGHFPITFTEQVRFHSRVDCEGKRRFP